MKRLLVLVAAAAFGACRTEPKNDAMAGMTAEDHARMQAADTAGAETRQGVHLSATQAAAIGVTFAVVERGPLTRTVRTVGQVVPAEPGLGDVTSKVDGYVDSLFVDATGIAVRRGQPLLALYSPMLVTAQEEVLTAARLAAAADSTDAEALRNARQLLDAARRRLGYWDISADQVERLERTGEVTKTLVLRAPFDGVVLEKMVVRGQAVMPAEKLYRLADLSTVWIEGAVFEQDLAAVRTGAAVRAELTAYPGRAFTGRVSFVAPTVNEQSRTAPVRVAFSNASRLLKPGMYATLFFDALIGAGVLQVPADAVVMTGERNLAFVVAASGALEPRPVVLGQRAGDRFEVLSGLEAGERIVASANFLVDAESRLGGSAGMAGMPGMPEHKP